MNNVWDDAKWSVEVMKLMAIVIQTHLIHDIKDVMAC